MIDIYKGALKRRVSLGAFKSLYEQAGWTTDKLPSENHEEDVFDHERENSHENDLDVNLDGKDGSEDDEYEEDGEDEENSHEKPLSEMSFKELKQYADFMQIDISAANNKKEVLEIIRASM